MFDQTPINRLNGIPWSPSNHPANRQPSEISGIKQLLADITELAELQIRLMAGDARATVKGTIAPVVFTLIGGSLLLAALPVLILSIASFLAARLAWPLEVAQLVSAGGAIFLGIVFGLVAINKLKHCVDPLARSLTELEKNMVTLRHMLAEKNGTDHTPIPGTHRSNN